MKDKILKRFLKYVSFDTQSSDTTFTHPSTVKQKELAKYLVDELHTLGVDNAFMDEYSYVYAKISGTNEEKTIGLAAHLDTALECSGVVNPKIIEKYNGEVIKINDYSFLDPKVFTQLNNQIGETLVTTDGTSLLGADDKAGIAIIMTLVEKILKEGKEYPNLIILFTPDEEIGEGTDKLNYEIFNPDFAYTLDGGAITDINYENFNAATAFLTFTGKAIHPGSAKCKMVNSQLVAMEFNSMLPDIRPDNTELYEGFDHITKISGGVEETKVEYIIRNHDLNLFHKQIQDFYDITNKLNAKYGYEVVKCVIKHSYSNMSEKVTKMPYVLDYPVNAIKAKGLVPHFVPIRGGTDGARMSYNGVVTPNLGTGGYNCHGPLEYASIDEMNQMVDILFDMLKEIK